MRPPRGTDRRFRSAGLSDRRRDAELHASRERDLVGQELVVHVRLERREALPVPRLVAEQVVRVVDRARILLVLAGRRAEVARAEDVEALRPELIDAGDPADAIEARRPGGATHEVAL